METKPPARDHEGARDPARIEAQDAPASVDGFLNPGTTDHLAVLSHDVFPLERISPAGHDDSRHGPNIKIGRLRPLVFRYAQ
jgi:hypothetical protein